MKLALGACITLLFLPFGLSAGAQSPRPYVGEIVVTSSGQLVAPWKESRVCGGKPDGCRTVVLNAATHEAACLDGKWSSHFELTGNGKEVRRAETAQAKARRLKTAGAPLRP